MSTTSAEQASEGAVAVVSNISTTQNVHESSEDVLSTTIQSESISKHSSPVLTSHHRTSQSALHSLPLSSSHHQSSPSAPNSSHKNLPPASALHHQTSSSALHSPHKYSSLALSSYHQSSPLALHSPHELSPPVSTSTPHSPHKHLPPVSPSHHQSSASALHSPHKFLPPHSQSPPTSPSNHQFSPLTLESLHRQFPPTSPLPRKSLPKESTRLHKPAQSKTSEDTSSIAVSEMPLTDSDEIVMMIREVPKDSPGKRHGLSLIGPGAAAIELPDTDSDEILMMIREVPEEPFVIIPEELRPEIVQPGASTVKSVSSIQDSGLLMDAYRKPPTPIPLRESLLNKSKEDYIKQFLEEDTEIPNIKCEPILPSGKAPNILDDKVEKQEKRYFTLEELKLHDNLDDFYVSCLGKVYDLTDFVAQYTDSPLIDPLLAMAGKDISHWFEPLTGELKSHIDPTTGIRCPYLPHGLIVHAPVPEPTMLWDNSFEIPWWEDESRVIGLLSAKTRRIRVVNTLLSFETILTVPNEEIMVEILKRHIAKNAHAASYVWKYNDKEMDMDKTLEENGIVDEQDLLSELNMDVESYLPAIFLYYSDNLSVG